MAHERLIAYLSSFFGILALGLASVGLYGVLAYAVTQRTREIGIRMALGAQRSDMVGMILRESFVPVLAGVVIGLVAAFSWSLFLGSLLYGVDSFDLESVSLAVTVMLAAALLAAAIPARTGDQGRSHGGAAVRMMTLKFGRPMAVVGDRTELAEN